MYRLIFILFPIFTYSQSVDTISIQGSVMYVIDSTAAVNIINKARKGESYDRLSREVDLLVSNISNQKIVSDKMQMLLQDQLTYMRSELIAETAKNRKLSRDIENFDKDKYRLKSQRNAFAATAIVLLTIIISN